jgi:thymidylate kinase
MATEFSKLNEMAGQLLSCGDGVLVPVAGGDSIGKSSWLDALKDGCNNLTVLSWHNTAKEYFLQLPNFPSNSEDFGLAIHQYIKSEDRAKVLFDVLMAWITNEIIPALNGGEVVVVDSYIYRFMSKEIVFYNQNALVNLFLDCNIPLPNAVFLIDNNPEIAWQHMSSRLRQPEFYETYHGKSNLSSFEAFESFQTDVDLQVRMILGSSGIPIVELSNCGGKFQKQEKWKLWNQILFNYLQTLVPCVV